MPERYGNWKSVHKRFRRWAKKGVWEEVFERLLKDVKNDYVMIDSTHVKAHQQAATEKRGRVSSLWGDPVEDYKKIHMLSDALGRPLHFVLTAGQKADCRSAEGLLAGQKAKAVIADKADDTNAIRAFIAAARMQAVIPSSSNRTEPIPYDRQLYKARNLIERCFGKLKVHRRITTRFDRNDSHFMGFLFFAASLIWI